MFIVKITVTKSIDHLSELLLPLNAPPVAKQDSTSKRWVMLKELRASNNYISNLDESLVRHKPFAFGLLNFISLYFTAFVDLH